MRKSPDGIGEKIDMQVPVYPVRVGVVILSGEDVRPKIGVGARDLPLEDWLYIENDHQPTGSYTKVEKVCMGMLALDDKPLQGRDQSYTSGGATFRQGTGPALADVAKPGELTAANDEQTQYDMAAWLVTFGDGRKSLLVVPDSLNSFEVADYIATYTDLEFCIESISAASYTANEDLLMPGWTILMDRSEVLDLAETRNFGR
jgi:hypothetical protein